MSRVRRLFWGLLAASLFFSGCNSKSGEKSSSRSTKVSKLSAQGDAGKASLVSPTALHAKETSRTQSAVSDAPTSVPVWVYYGKVTRQSAGAALAGASVELAEFRYGELDGPVIASAKTSADGSYELVTTSSVVPNVLRASAKGCARMRAVAGSQASFGLDPAPKVYRIRRNISLPEAVELRGKVVDENNQPVTSVRLRALDNNFEKIGGSDTKTTCSDILECASGPDGSFAFEQAARAKYTLYVESSRHVPLIQQVSAPDSNVLLRLSSQGGVIEGNVLKLNTSEGVSSASVELYCPAITGGRQSALFDAFKTVTKAGGAFRLDRLPKGAYEIRAQAGELRTFEVGTTPLDLEEKQTTSGVKVFVYGGHTVFGKVSERESGKALSGAKVVVLSHEKGPVVVESDAQGQFRMEKVFFPEVGLSARKKGYKVSGELFQEVKLPAETLEVEKNIEMVPAAQVSGLVRMEGGSPIAGARVGIAEVGPLGNDDVAQTDAQGIYELDVTPFSTVCLKAETSGYPDAFSEPLRVDDRPVSAPEIIVKPGGTICGTVVDPAGKPVEAARVFGWIDARVGTKAQLISMPIAETQSEASGAFSLPMLPEGKVNVWAAKKGYGRSKDIMVEVKSAQTKSGVQVALQTSHFISGKVTDKGGQPAADVTVHASGQKYPGNSNTQSDAQGQYRIDDLPEDTYTVMAHGKAGSGQKQNIAPDSEHVDIVLSSQEGKQASKPKGKGKMIGKVIDWKSRMGIVNFTVEVLDHPGAQVEKDSLVPGRFTITGLRAHEAFGAKISAPGHLAIVPRDLSIGSEDGQPVEREFILGTGGTISGRVVEQGSAKPLEGVAVLFLGGPFSGSSQSGAPSKTTHTAADGTFAFENMGVGTNVIEFRPAPPLLSTRRNFEVANGSVSDLGDIELGAGATLTGKLLRKRDESPVSGLEVTVLGGRDFTKSAKTGADGSFRVEALPPGDYTVTVAQYNLTSAFNIKTETSKEVVLYVGDRVLNGVVLKRGQPLKGARITLAAQVEQQGSIEATTDAEGKFRIEGIAPGKPALFIRSYVGEASGAGYPAESSLSEIIEFSEQSDMNRTFDMPWATITGHVLDGSGAGVAGAEIGLQSNSSNGYRGYAQSGADGSFSFEGLSGGEYQLSTSKSDLGSASAKVTVAANADSAGTVLKLEKTNGATLVSTVIDTEGKPIPAAWCWLDGVDGRFKHSAGRDAKGLMTINDIPPGSYKVSVGYWGYSSTERQMELKAGESQRIDDALYLAGALRWILQDKTGAAQRGVPCTLTPLDPNSIEKPRSGPTDGMGVWIVRGLFGGDYTATATPPSGKPVSMKVTITVGQLNVQTTQLE